MTNFGGRGGVRQLIHKQEQTWEVYAKNLPLTPFPTVRKVLFEFICWFQFINRSPYKDVTLVKTHEESINVLSTIAH